MRAPIETLVTWIPAGGVFILPGVFPDTRAALAELTARAAVPPGVDRTLLLNLLDAREQRHPTTLGGGVAVPHPLRPESLGLKHPVVNVAFPTSPIPHPDTLCEPTRLLFLVLSPGPAHHIAILARIARLAQEQTVVRRLLDGPHDEDAVRRLLAESC